MNDAQRAALDYLLWKEGEVVDFRFLMDYTGYRSLKGFYHLMHSLRTRCSGVFRIDNVRAQGYILRRL